MKKSREEHNYITDHALIRYFERVLGFDMEVVKKTILDDGKRIEMIEAGCKEIKCSGFVLRIKDKKVVTIIR